VAELRVAIDLDGTIADLSAAMHTAAKRKRLGDDDTAEDGPGGHGRDPQDRPALRDLSLSPYELDRLWSRVLKIKNFWTTLREMEYGVVKRIADLAAERRWDVIFITTRPAAAGDTTQVQSQRWLASFGFQYPSVYVIRGSRGRVAGALQLDAVIDDRPENCLDVAVESNAKAILVWPGDQSGLPPGITRQGVTIVPTIGAALDELVALDRARTGSVVRSIKRLLGRS
jgi:hypothetical protein